MLNKFSKKREKQNEEYKINRKNFLLENPFCELCGTESTDLHHKKGRTGKLLNDFKYFMSLCRSCHRKIEDNREWSYSKGYLIKRNSSS